MSRPRAPFPPALAAALAALSVVMACSLPRFAGPEVRCGDQIDAEVCAAAVDDVLANLPQWMPPIRAVGADSMCNPRLSCPHAITRVTAVVLVHDDGAVNLITVDDKKLTLYRGTAPPHVATMLGVVAGTRLDDPERLPR